MEFEFKPMTEADRDSVLAMMSVFYASPALASNGSPEVFTRDIEACVGDCPFLEGYIIRRGEDIAGYAMLARGFSTECGLPCLWLEDLYVKESVRGIGAGGLFLDFVRERNPGTIIKLEVARENLRAIKLYTEHGFDPLPYLVMAAGFEK